VRVIAIVQARMNSTRLINKVMRDIVGKPMLWHIVNRLQHAKTVEEIVISAASGRVNKPIIDFAEENHIPYYAGSELDLIDRWYQTAIKFKADAIVRVTGDCPLVDPILTDALIDYYIKNQPLDFVSNSRPKASYPHGLDVESYSFSALKRAWNEVEGDFLREWGSVNFFEHPETYRIANLSHSKDLSNLRWVVDYEDDLEFVREIYRNLYKEGEAFLMEDILKLLERNPQIAQINKKHVGDDTYRLLKGGKLNVY